MIQKMRRFADRDNLIRNYRFEISELFQLEDIYHKSLLPYFGDALIAFSDIKKMHHVNPQSFHSIFKTDKNGGSDEMCGVVALMPLTDKAAQSMRTLTLTGSDLKPIHIASPAEQSKSGYLALCFVTSANPRDRSACLVFTGKLCLTYSEVLMGPSTPEGLKVTQLSGAQPLFESEDSPGRGLYQWRNISITNL